MFSSLRSVGARDTARAVFVVLLLVLPLTPLALATDDPSGHVGDVPDAVAAVEERAGLLPHDAPKVPVEPTPAVDDDVLVVVQLRNGAELPVGTDIEVQQVYDREGAQHVEGVVPLTAVRRLGRNPSVEAVRIERLQYGESDRVAAGVQTVGAAALHERGLSGENVTVGVIDSGFRLSDPEIAGHVRAYRAFGDDANEQWLHGTAVASVVADTAPGADLHLAAVGASTTPEEYAAAVSWLRESGADVIVDSGSYFGQPGDGHGKIAAVAANASDDVLFVTSAGNYAQRHWSGTHEANGESEWVEFADGTEVNRLADGQRIGGRVQVSLAWNDWPATDDDYDLYLFRRLAGRDEVVAVSTTRQAGDTPVEHIDARVPEGQYYVAVKAHDATGSHRLHLFASHSLSLRNASGSLTAPGTAPGVLTVGAVEGDRVRSFSSRGPVPGTDRLGVDLVAPDSVAIGVPVGGGTSYAAPYAAGTAALLKSRYPALTAGDLRTILRTTASDVGPEGPDAASGHGALDARAAADLAAENARYAAVNGTETAD